MRQLHTRVLAARGIQIGIALVAKGVRVRTAHDQSGTSLLVLRGKILGPNWPSIAEAFDQEAIDYSLVEVGKIWLVTADCERVRHFVSQLHNQARQSANEKVLVPDVGFVSAGKKKLVEARALLAPIAVAVISIGLAFIPASVPEQADDQPQAESSISCALDLSAGEIREWVTASITNRDPNSSSVILVRSDLGLLSLEIRQTLGSTQSVRGSIECEDGRSTPLHYRIDASANGSLVELGPRLDP